MATLLRLSNADQGKYPGGDENGWVRFDVNDLDDIPWQTQYEWEMGDLGISIDFLLAVDWIAKTARGKAGLVWLARTIAGIETPPLEKFDVNVRRIEVKEDKPAKTGEDKEADADPPSEAPSSEVEVSGTESPKSSRRSARSTTKDEMTSGQ